MTDDERLRASKKQIYTFIGSQYQPWRLVAVKSIRKILLNLDEFYDGDHWNANTDDQYDVVHCQIRNGWFFEAISQAEQAIEDLFASVMQLGNLSFFTKDELFYNAARVKKYIWEFDINSTEKICRQFGYPYHSIEEPHDERWAYEAFVEYKKAVLLTQRYVKEMQEFHKKYYDDYCQYKHGLSVGLAPMQNLMKKGDIEQLQKIQQKPLEGALFTFQNGTIEQHEKRTGKIPTMMIHMKPGMLSHISELYSERNLLFSTVHVVYMDEVIDVTEHACILLSVFWKNVLKRLEDGEIGEQLEVMFPTESLKKQIVIGFSKGK